MTRDEVDTKAKEMIAEHLGVDPGKVTDEANLFDDLGADSLDVVELVMSIEAVFGVEITDDEGADLKSVRDTVDLIASKSVRDAA